MSTLFLIMLPWRVIFMVVMNWFGLHWPIPDQMDWEPGAQRIPVVGMFFQDPSKRLRIMLRLGGVPRNRTTVPGG